MIVYKGRVFNIELKRKTLPNGSKADLDMIVHNGVVVILPIKGKNIVFERQYRPILDRWLYELPAGMIEKGEKPKDCAIRELKEETGLTAKTLKLLFTSFASPGMSTERLYFFVASGLKKGGQELDEHEVINIRELPLKKLVWMIRTGKIIDGKTIQGLLYYSCFV